jgi:uncharacterized protein (TIGR02266 family)
MLRDEQNPRFSFDGPVALFLDGAPLPLRGRAHNLSRGGMFVTSHKLFQRGARVDLSFKLPGGQRVKARACVTRRVNTSTDQEPVGMALRFLQFQQPGDELELYLNQQD